jgi:uncharacterized OB-fold protein
MAGTGDGLGLLPEPDRDSARWWAALGEGHVEVQRCTDCDAWTWPPRPICSGCHGEHLAWREVSGLGEVHSWVVAHQVYAPSLASLVPYTVVLVRLDEQPDLLVPGRFLSDVEVRGGLRVRAVAQRVEDDLGVLEWEADPAG